MAAERRGGPRGVSPRWAALVLASGLSTVGAQAAGAPDQGPPAGAEAAVALIEAREFERAQHLLRDILSSEPQNRRAKELLAFALEASGDVEAELVVRADLAAEFAADARAQADYGRALERSGDEAAALAAYRRARELSPGADPELDVAIDRMKGRTTTELGVPIVYFSDPDATATRTQAGLAVPLRSPHHIAFSAAHYDASASTGESETASDLVAVSLVLRNPSGAALTIGPRFHSIASQGDASRDVAIGGVVAGRLPLGRSFEMEAGAQLDAPWDEAAVAVLHGGRSTGAQGRVYSHFFSRRLLLGLGGGHRTLSILPADPESSDRPTASQSLYDAGADVLLWRSPGLGLRGEILDDSLTSPASLPAALTLRYRHYEVYTETTPDFASQIALAPRGSVDEVSAGLGLVSPRGRFGFDLDAGLGRDSARDARLWRAGARFCWAPTSAMRVTLEYEGATDAVTGLVGRRHTGRLSFHADL